MNFGLLLSQFPHVTESRSNYDAMLSLDIHRPAFARLLNQLKSLFH
ncbi:hypothetical protein [Burkholderia stagnalis]|nr:hypothetical protein [Burkholderia stagnalis]WGS44108.1 hypothetical protein LFL97_26225 [Burkholderia sp. JSH-S8]